MYRIIINLYLECTYTPDALSAIQLIDNQLEKEIVQTEKELQRDTTLITQYRSIGTEFPKLVREYTQLASKLEQNKSYLLSLQKGESPPPPQNPPSFDSDESDLDMDVET